MPDIHDIPTVPNEIKDAASKGKLVIFVGAGASRIIGCPSWQSFAMHHLKNLFDEGMINFHEYSHLSKEEPRKLLSICFNIYAEEKLLPLRTRDVLQADPKKLAEYPIYDDLYSFNSIYVTTNYDMYLDQAAAKVAGSIPEPLGSTEPSGVVATKPELQIVSAIDELLISKLNNGTIIHLHGSAENESDLIITLTDYMMHYTPGSNPAVFLEEIFKSYTVLFVGYGLEEYEILEFMISKSNQNPGTIQHYMLYPVFRSESQLLKFQDNYYADLGIKLIPYPKDNNGYDQLANVIKEWAKQVGHVSQPRQYFDKIRLIDEVLT